SSPAPWHSCTDRRTPVMAAPRCGPSPTSTASASPRRLEPMATVGPPRLHHLAITVTDVDASVPWYERVFGVKFLADVPHPGGVGKLLATEDMSLMIVLHRHDTNDGGLFAETATGLDHAGFMVSTRDDLVAWQDH